jgi:hypothetical protein
MDKINEKIDSLLKIRQDAMFNYARSTSELIDLGVKIKNKETDDTIVPVSFEQYLDKYNISNLEFEWEAKYKDGSVLRQFEGEEQRNFSHIDQERLASISFISNFNWPSEEGRDPRIIVRLNWETGLFEFQNGFISQDVRSVACMNPLEGEKKLILFSRKRFSSSNGEINNQYKEFFPFEDEVFYYNRFILGYETKTGTKALIINPNGNIEIFEK